MTTLGSWPEDRYAIAWMTQRLANRAPEYAHLRQSPFSIGQQVMNPTGSDIQRVTQQLYEERNNMFMSSADINLIDKLYHLELDQGMEFTRVTTTDGSLVYSPPTVFATINNTEYQITIAKNNDIKTLWYEALPSRLEYSEESYSYDEVVPRSALSSLASITPSSISLYGHLYITVRSNTSWSYRGRTKIFFPKVFVKGITRKRTEVTEAIPISYNGTFKTVNQWRSIESVFASYMDEAAELTVEILPFDQESALDVRNIVANPNGVESRRFIKLGTRSWGSSLISEGFTVTDLETIQAGVNVKDTEYEIELLDGSGSNITALGMALKQNTNYIFVADATKLYVYDSRLPYPDMKELGQESSDTKMDLYSDKWVYSRDETATVLTDNLDVSNPPWKFRWTLEQPNGTTYYLLEDGSKVATTTDAWIDNTRWEEGDWEEQTMDVLLNQTGTYIITIECLYSDMYAPGREDTKTTRYLFYVPAIQPEVTLDLPTTLKNSEGIMFDSDANLWFLKSDIIYKADLFYDYFLVDYERNTVWLRENYSSVRVVL
jgi:hypothetical protein